MSLFPNLEWTTLSHQVGQKKAGSRSRDTRRGLHDERIRDDVSKTKSVLLFVQLCREHCRKEDFFYERMDACVMLFRSDYVFANNGVESEERSLSKKFRKVSLREFISL